MVNTQPSQSNPVDLTSYEESLLHLINHSVGEGTTRYHRSGSVHLQLRSTTPSHQLFYTAEEVTAGIWWLTPNHHNPILLISLHTKRAFYISPTTAWGKGLRVITGAVQLIHRSTPTLVILHYRKRNCRHRLGNRQSTTPHKLWLAVRRWLQQHAFNKQCIRWLSPDHHFKI